MQQNEQLNRCYYFLDLLFMVIHSFIHTEHLYSASSRELLRGAQIDYSIDYSIGNI